MDSPLDNLGLCNVSTRKRTSGPSKRLPVGFAIVFMSWMALAVAFRDFEILLEVFRKMLKSVYFILFAAVVYSVGLRLPIMSRGPPIKKLR